VRRWGCPCSLRGIQVEREERKRQHLKEARIDRLLDEAARGDEIRPSIEVNRFVVVGRGRPPQIKDRPKAVRSR
jgi:hypothetical protein